MKPRGKKFYRIIEDIEKGIPLRAIARNLNVPYPTVTDLQRRFIKIVKVAKNIPIPEQLSLF